MLDANRKRVAILTLGCKVNQYESEAMIRILKDHGYIMVDFKEEADIYIVNTCSVTNVADKKSRQMLHRAKKLNPEAVVVACGCYVQAAGEELLSDGAVDIILGNNLKTDIVSVIEAYFDGEEVAPLSENEKAEPECKRLIDIGAEKSFEAMSITETTETTRAYIKVQDGCNQFCSYCIIPYVRGRIRSRSIADCVYEITTLSEHGIKEVVLTGIHLSSYGMEKDFGIGDTSDYLRDTKEETLPLIDLIEAVSGIEGINRIRLGSLEPRIITDSFLGRIAKIEKLCPHFHLSLQSASNATLKRMNRHYTIEEYMEKCNLIRSYFDRPAITTDVIVGFPGETEEEFSETVANLEKLNLYEMHIFKYSRRKGTVADKLPDQVDERIKNERSDILLAMTERHKAAYEESFSGEKLSVLVEEKVEKDGKKWYIGHTPNYIRVALDADEYDDTVINQIVEVDHL